MLAEGYYIVHFVVVSLFSVVFLLGALLTINEALLRVFGQVTDGSRVVLERSLLREDTTIAGPTELTVKATTTIEITIANEGNVTLGRFSDWDVIFEILETSCLGIAYLTYTENTIPGKNEWSVKGIYLDASTLTPETLDPGLFNPGEEMIVLANPSPSVAHKTYNRATFRGGLVCLNSAARFDKWNRAAVR